MECKNVEAIIAAARSIKQLRKQVKEFEALETEVGMSGQYIEVRYGITQAIENMVDYIAELSEEV